MFNQIKYVFLCIGYPNLNPLNTFCKPIDHVGWKKNGGKVYCFKIPVLNSIGLF